mgnify:FL=1
MLNLKEEMNVGFTILALTNIKGIGSKTLFKAREELLSWNLLEPRDILEILEQLIVSKKLPEKFYQITIKDAEMAFTEAAKIFSDIDSKNVRISTFLEDSFPLEAVNLENPPAFLYYQGDIRLLKRQKLAIVGTRKPTAFGLKKAQEIAKEAADYKVVVVSGLALGVDSAAHKGVLLSTRPESTIAVLPSGAGDVYPASNKKLAFEILKNGGLLISERPPGAEIQKHNFVKRDRIIAAIADGVLAIEAACTSGTLITMNYGFELGRKLFVLNHSVDYESEDTIGGLKKAAAQYGALWINEFGDLMGSFGQGKS